MLVYLNFLLLSSCSFSFVMLVLLVFGYLLALIFYKHPITVSYCYAIEFTNINIDVGMCKACESTPKNKSNNL